VVEVYQLLHQGTMATVRVRGETIRATGGHPFWVVRGERLADRPAPVRIKPYEVGGRQQGRWVLARDLRAGDEVLLRHGEVVALESVVLDEVEERVYNFHVAELQNYAVGACGVLVHNTNDPAPRGRGRFATDAELQDHFRRHGRDFGTRTPSSYERQAADFLQGRRGPGVLEKIRPDGSTVRFNPATDEYGIIGPNGAVVTYFKPNPAIHGFPTNLDYFNAQ
jgi:hypothetical protein